MMHPYCAYVSAIKDKDDVDKVYHDRHYGVSIKDDNELFGRLIMEINQAGLSWRTILLKERGFRKAYHDWNVRKIARYTQKDVERLLSDTSIIRNRLKIDAAIHNAQAVEALQKEYGSFQKWISLRSKELKHDRNAWVKEFKKHFKFVGGEIVGEFLMSINLLPGSHDPTCHRFRKI